jgi:hypothetical protein
MFAKLVIEREGTDLLSNDLDLKHGVRPDIASEGIQENNSVPRFDCHATRLKHEPKLFFRCGPRSFPERFCKSRLPKLKQGTSYAWLKVPIVA